MSVFDWGLLMVLSQVPFWLGYGLIAWALWSTYIPCPHCGERMRRGKPCCPHCGRYAPAVLP